MGEWDCMGPVGGLGYLGRQFQDPFPRSWCKRSTRPLCGLVPRSHQCPPGGSVGEGAVHALPRPPGQGCPLPDLSRALNPGDRCLNPGLRCSDLRSTDLTEPAANGLVGCH